jgi:hypothetical protein
VKIDLGRKLFGPVESAERMVVGLAENLTAAGTDEFLQQLDHIGRVLFELFEQCAGDGERDAEAAFPLSSQVGEHDQ